MSRAEAIASEPPTTPGETGDRTAWAIVGLGVLLSLLVEGLSGQTEILRLGIGYLSQEWLFEITSHIAILLAALTIPLWLNRFPLRLSTWKRQVPFYGLGFILFTAIHILLMVAMRHLLWPLVASGTYDFGLFQPEPWLYEMRKDALTYLIILSVFLNTRHVVMLSEELRATREEARETGNLHLKSGGRLVTLPASEILYAKSAANYVEIKTRTGQHFVRLTLSELETLMEEARVEPVRLHRSYLASRSVIREVTGRHVMLETGETLPVGRAFKDRVLD